MAEAMAIHLPTRQVDVSDRTQAALDVPTNSGEEAVPRSAATNPPSKKRKAKAGVVDWDCESARALLELSNNIPSHQADKWMDEGQVTRRALKKGRKRKKRAETVKGDRTEPESDWEFFEKSGKSQELGTKERGRKSGKKREHLSFNTPHKPKAFIGQRDDHLTAEETLKPRKGRKRRRHRKDETPADVILSSGDGKTKSSTQRNPGGRENSPDEPSSLQPEGHKMEQQDFQLPMIQPA